MTHDDWDYELCNAESSLQGSDVAYDVTLQGPLERLVEKDFFPVVIVSHRSTLFASHDQTDTCCLDVGACLKVNTRALGRAALHKKGGSIPLLLTSEHHTGRAFWQLFTRSV